MVLVRRPSRLRSLNFSQSLIQVEVALLVILIEQSWKNYGFMLQKEFLHWSAIVEKFFYNPQHFSSILEMCGKKVNIDDDINQGDIRFDSCFVPVQMGVEYQHLGCNGCVMGAYGCMRISDGCLWIHVNAYGCIWMIWLCPLTAMGRIESILYAFYFIFICTGAPSLTHQRQLTGCVRLQTHSLLA